MPGNPVFITLDKDNILSEHICCAFSDKKCAEGYRMKKQWLANEFANGLVFRRLDERAKVFLEYGPAEKAWVPVDAPGYLMLGCFWVSGRYKGNGYAKELLQSAMDDARRQGRKGLVAVAGKKKLPFMADAGWLVSHGFEIIAELPEGFVLLASKIDKTAPDPKFRESVQAGGTGEKGITVYYSDRCPYTDFHVNTTMRETMEKRGLEYKVIKLETMDQARSAPTPATVFSLFMDGKFVTTDLSVCLDSRFDKILR